MPAPNLDSSSCGFPASRSEPCQACGSFALATWSSEPWINFPWSLTVLGQDLYTYRRDCETGSGLVSPSQEGDRGDGCLSCVCVDVRPQSTRVGLAPAQNSSATTVIGFSVSSSPSLDRGSRLEPHRICCPTLWLTLCSSIYL